MATKTRSKSKSEPKVGKATAQKKRTSRTPDAPKTEVAPKSNTGKTTTQPAPSENAVAFAGGDVDVAEVDPGSGKGEAGPVILEGFWVRIGQFKGVDDGFVGHVATVQRSPWQPAPIGVPHSGIAGYTYDEENTLFVVRTRDASSALLELPQEAFTEWGQARVDLTQHG